MTARTWKWCLLDRSCTDHLKIQNVYWISNHKIEIMWINSFEFFLLSYCRLISLNRLISQREILLTKVDLDSFIKTAESLSHISRIVTHTKNCCFNKNIQLNNFSLISVNSYNSENAIGDPTFQVFILGFVKFL